MSDEMNLEKLRIVQKLGEVENQLIRMDGSINLQGKTLESIDKRVETHSIEIWGNGKTGLKMKVDRIVQRQLVINWVLCACFIAILGIASRLAYNAFASGG